jgi:hypothetical protein
MALHRLVDCKYSPPLRAMKDRARCLAELELGENATPDEVRQAYRDMAKVWHPDRFPNDLRMQARATEKLRRIIEAYEFLKSHPTGVGEPGQAQPRYREEHTKQGTRYREQHTKQGTRTSEDQRREEGRRALATLKERARFLNQRVRELQRQRAAGWERKAWISIGFGMAIPVALVFILPIIAKVAGTLLWLVFTGSGLSFFALIIYRTVQMHADTSDALRAVRRADVTCSRCGSGVVGYVSPTTAEQALGRAGWALKHLRCPHCRQPLVSRGA